MFRNWRQNDLLAPWGPSIRTYISPLCTFTDPFRCHCCSKYGWFIGGWYGGCQTDRSISIIVLKIGLSMLEAKICLFKITLGVEVTTVGVVTGRIDGKSLLFGVGNITPVLCKTLCNSGGYVDCRWGWGGCWCWLRTCCWRIGGWFGNDWDWM